MAQECKAFGDVACHCAYDAHVAALDGVARNAHDDHHERGRHRESNAGDHDHRFDAEQAEHQAADDRAHKT